MGIALKDIHVFFRGGKIYGGIWVLLGDAGYHRCTQKDVTRSLNELIRSIRKGPDVLIRDP